MITGWFFLNKDGDLVYESYPEKASALREDESVKMLWSYDPDDRGKSWSILVEAVAAGANVTEIKELAKKWNFDDNDATIYGERVGCLLKMEGNQWCATRLDFSDMMESPIGFGDTVLEAMAELCKELGYQPCKTWGNSFENLLK